MGLNLDEIMNYLKYNTLNTKRKYQEIRIENMFTEEQKIWISDENIDPQNIIFSDEKYICLKPHPNRQKNRF